MSKIIEEYVEKKVAEKVAERIAKLTNEQIGKAAEERFARKLIKQGKLSLDEIADTVELPRKEIELLAEKILQEA